MRRAAYAIQWARSFVFLITTYGMMAVIGIVFFPWALVHRNGAFAACKSFCVWVRWSASWMVGIKTEVRGTPPVGQVMIASKHQSFLDTILIFGSLPAGRYIMKRELLWTPFVGLYGLRIGCVAVDRGKRAMAIKKMVEDVKKGHAHPGQLIIYPQGTRISPGVKAPYKIGTSVLYEELGQPCVPAATNVGVFWPRRGIIRRPGLAVVEFLDTIEPGLEKTAFMERIEREIEGASNKLMAEAGFDVDGLD